MNRRIALVVTTTVASLFLLGATPLQSVSLADIPWWVWILGTAVVLLLLFLVVMRLDWNAAAARKDDHE